MIHLFNPITIANRLHRFRCLAFEVRTHTKPVNCHSVMFSFETLLSVAHSKIIKIFNLIIIEFIHIY